VSTYDIRFCKRQDAARVRQFIAAYWKPGHILAENQALFEWQYWDPQHERYNIVIADAGPAMPLLGVLGYIPTAAYDPELAGRNVIWLALWKVRPDAGVAGLGLALHHHLARHAGGNRIAALGLTPLSQRVLAGLGYQLVTLDQYFLINPRRSGLKLAHVRTHVLPLRAPLDPTSRIERLDERSLRAIPMVRLGERALLLPAKSPTYFLNRYLRHPFYKYEVYAVGHGEQIDGLMAMRAVSHEESSALRVVDYWGSRQGLRGLGGVLANLAIEREAEYVDLLCYGLPPAEMEQEGLARLDVGGDTIIPNYFEPFEQRNVSIMAAFRSGPPAGHYVLFKADGDQDRPNRLALPAAP
jgi:hypothetical protein